jgi:hypothetical protein
MSDGHSGRRRLSHAAMSMSTGSSTGSPVAASSSQSSQS